MKHTPTKKKENWTVKELRSFIDNNQLSIKKYGKGVTKAKLVESIHKVIKEQSQTIENKIIKTNYKSKKNVKSETTKNKTKKK